MLTEVSAAVAVEYCAANVPSVSHVRHRRTFASFRSCHGLRLRSWTLDPASAVSRFGPTGRPSQPGGDHGGSTSHVLHAYLRLVASMTSRSWDLPASHGPCATGVRCRSGGNAGSTRGGTCRTNAQPRSSWPSGVRSSASLPRRQSRLPRPKAFEPKRRDSETSTRPSSGPLRRTIGPNRRRCRSHRRPRHRRRMRRAARRAIGRSLPVPRSAPHDGLLHSLDPSRRRHR